jgi:hypothetical protein
MHEILNQLIRFISFENESSMENDINRHIKQINSEVKNTK